MNDRQLIVEVRDQFALKNASDATLRKILPSYEMAIERIINILKAMPDGDLSRELWLKSQLATIERQFQAVADRINAVMPPDVALQFEKAMDNAADFLRADDIRPGADSGQDLVLSGQTVGGETVTVKSPVPVITGDDGYIRPSITRQQIEAASRSGGFEVFTLDSQKVKLDDVLPNWKKAQAEHLANVLRTGFLSGESTKSIMRQFGKLGPGRQGWAMTEAVVRTGMAEAGQAAHDAFFDANEDLLPKVPDGYRWEWDALNDTRLCILCAPLDGLRYKTRKEMPEKPHWNCRCSKLPITATEAQMRKDGDLPEGSYLERKPVTYTAGRRDPAPEGWNGDNAYKRPQRMGWKTVNGKKRPEMFWVRRREMAVGRTTPGDMLQKMDRHNQHAIFQNWSTVDRFNALTKEPGSRFHKDPQSAVRLLLSSSKRAAPPAGVGRPNR